MSAEKGLIRPLVLITVSLLIAAAVVTAVEVMFLGTLPETEAATVIANPGDYMASPTLDDPADGVNGYFGEGAAD